MDITYERFCFPVTFRCNLNCKLCAEHSPYNKKPYHPSLKELKTQMDELFRIVTHIGKFDITGGEPFLRKDLPEVISYLHDNYYSQIDMVRVTTNGTLLPPNGFLKIASKWSDRIYVIVDNYPVSNKSEKVYKQLQAAGVPGERRDYSEDLHCDGWVDYGDLSLKHSREEAEKLFHKCMIPKLGFFTCMSNGHIYPCAKARLLHEHFISSISMNMFDPELSCSGKKARMQALMGEEVIDACRYCNGLCEDSPRFPPAEQIDISGKEPQLIMEPEEWRVQYGKVIVYTQTYNNEKTIARTIESVLKQTNQNFTYFICNNGSTDRTGEIIRRYAKTENAERFVFVECERNDILGVLKIPGNLFQFIPQYTDHYYTIVDGDDTIEHDFLEHVLTMIEQQHPDMIVASVNRINAETEEVLNCRKPAQDLVVSGRKKADDFMIFRPLLLAQWGKVHRWKTFKRCTNVLLYKYTLHVPKWFYTSDAVGVLSYFYQYEKVGFISKPGYNYYLSSESVFHSYIPERVKTDELMFKINNDFLEKFPPVSQRNRDYCYAIYLSLLDDTLTSILNARSVPKRQKLIDILNILTAETTQNLFHGSFDPIFYNLTHRDDFINRIREYMENVSAEISDNELCQKIEEKLNQLG